MEWLIAVMLGVLSSFIVVLFVEWKRQPRLVLSITPPSDQSYPKQERPAEFMRSLRIGVRNKELSRFLRWMKRDAARNCLGTIQFLYLDGTKYFTDPMPGRWAGSPEAVPINGRVTNAGAYVGEVMLWDPVRLTVISKMDIPAGEQEDLDLVIRCDDEPDAYGWNNDSYRFNWRNPNWRLPKDRYYAEVTVRSEGQKISKRFLINNDLTRDQFRLEPVPDE
jgi:hypothetical protein